MYKLRASKQAKKDYETAKRAGHGDRLGEILAVMERAPYESTSGHYFEKLSGNLKDAYSRRINYHNRIVYSVYPNTENVIDLESKKPYEGIVCIHRAWGHNYAAIPKPPATHQ